MLITGVVIPGKRAVLAFENRAQPGRHRLLAWDNVIYCISNALYNVSGHLKPIDGRSVGVLDQTVP